MTIHRLRRLGRQFLFGSAGLLLGWSTTGTLAAQPPGAEPAAAPSAPPIQRHYFNKSVIQIPVEIKEQSRSLIQEIQLHYKDQPGAAWTLRDKVDAGSKGFMFQVPKDGEYWFAMVTLDKQGRSYPPDIRNESPGLIVVIDTQKPVIELTNLGTPPEGQLIQCKVQDTHLDNARTRFYYQGGDRVFRVLDPVAGRPGVYCIPTQAVFTGLVRVMAEDLAGNQAQVEIHMNQVPAAKPEPVMPPPAPIMPPPRTPVTNPMTVDPAPVMPPPRMPVTNPMSVEPGPLPRFPSDTPGVKHEEPSNAKPTVASGRPDGSDGPHWQINHKADSPASPSPLPKETLKRQFVNNTRVFLDYQIENAGQGNVAKVEVWMTRDRAKTWHKASEDAQRKNQIELQFPGEGIFGVTLVASNSRGVAGTPPTAGDAPDWWIEVDTSKPVAQITKAQPVMVDGKAVIHIHWTAQDKNLGDTPVDLFYAASPQGPWQPIAKGLKAEGQHQWSSGADIGSRMYLRLSVQDTAGNTSVVDLAEPVVIDGSARPRAIIRSVSTPGHVAAPSTPTPTSPVIQIVQPQGIR